MQGCIKTATQSRCTMQRHKWLSMHRCNGTNGCHCTDATAQMAVIAQMQRHKWLSLHRCNGTNGCRCTDVATQTADEARMLTSNNLYNFSSKVLTNYNNILQNPFKFVILYQKDQKTKKPKEPKDR